MVVLLENPIIHRILALSCVALTPLACDRLDELLAGRLDHPNPTECTFTLSEIGGATPACSGVSLDYPGGAVDRAFTSEVAVARRSMESPDSPLVEILATTPVTLKQPGVLRMTGLPSVAPGQRLALRNLALTAGDAGFATECLGTPEGGAVECVVSSIGHNALVSDPSAPDGVTASRIELPGGALHVPDGSAVDIFQSVEGGGPCGRSRGQRGLAEPECRSYVWSQVLEQLVTPDTGGSDEMDEVWGEFLTATDTGRTAVRYIGDNRVALPTKLHRIDAAALDKLMVKFDEMIERPTTRSLGHVGRALAEALLNAGVSVEIGRESLRLMLDAALIIGDELDSLASIRRRVYPDGARATDLGDCGRDETFYTGLERATEVVNARAALAREAIVDYLAARSGDVVPDLQGLFAPIGPSWLTKLHFGDLSWASDLRYSTSDDFDTASDDLGRFLAAARQALTATMLGSATWGDIAGATNLDSSTSERALAITSDGNVQASAILSYLRDGERLLRSRRDNVEARLEWCPAGYPDGHLSLGADCGGLGLDALGGATLALMVRTEAARGDLRTIRSKKWSSIAVAAREDPPKPDAGIEAPTIVAPHPAIPLESCPHSSTIHDVTGSGGCETRFWAVPGHRDGQCSARYEARVPCQDGAFVVAPIGGNIIPLPGNGTDASAIDGGVVCIETDLADPGDYLGDRPIVCVTGLSEVLRGPGRVDANDALGLPSPRGTVSGTSVCSFGLSIEVAPIGDGGISHLPPLHVDRNLPAQACIVALAPIGDPLEILGLAAAAHGASPSVTTTTEPTDGTASSGPETESDASAAPSPADESPVPSEPASEGPPPVPPVPPVPPG